MFFHPDSQRADTAQNQKAIERRGACAHRVLQAADLLCQFRIACDDRASDDIGVAVDVFRGGVDDQVNAQAQRTLKAW
jgi:hypothetical protein